jgi:hypothetical protein
MELAFSLVDTSDDGQRIHVAATVATSGNYSTGGDMLDLSQVQLIASAQPLMDVTAWIVSPTLRYYGR